MNTQLFCPGTFKKINEKVFFRLETGEIACSTTEQVVLDTSIKDMVELIEIKNEKASYYLWKINNEFSPLEKMSVIILPAEVEFVDYYETQTSTFVKYTVGKNYGMLKEQNKKLTVAISHEKNYKDLYYSNNGFIAETEDEKTYILDINGNVLRQLPVKGIKSAGHDVFYNKHQIYTQNFVEEEIDCEIEKVEVIDLFYSIIVKSITNKGNKYYNGELRYLLGPVENEEFEHDFQDKCYVYEKNEGKIKRVFYISKDSCTSISSKSEIKKEFIASNSITQDTEMFFVIEANGKKTVYFSNLTCLIDNVNEYTISSIETGVYSNEYSIVGYVNDEPTKVVLVNKSNFKLEKYKLQPLFKNCIDSTNSLHQYICKSDDRILCISGDRGVVFNVVGDSCKTKFWGTDVPRDAKFRKMVYLVEKEDSIVVIGTDGRIIK